MDFTVEAFDRFKKDLKSTGINLVKTQITISIITLAILTVCFYMFDLEHAFLIALGITVVDILPVIGSGVIMIPWSAYLIISGNNVDLGIKIAIVYIALTILRQILEPLIRGKTLGLTPITTIASCIVGYLLFNALGLVIGPAIAIVCQSFYRIFVKDKSLPEGRE